MSHVRSDIPTLVFQQGLDTQTPASFGRIAARGLVNHFYVEWPTEGHVIAARSLDGCAGDIAASFFDNPRSQPNSQCSVEGEQYRIPFEKDMTVAEDRPR